MAKSGKRLLLCWGLMARFDQTVAVVFLSMVVVVQAAHAVEWRSARSAEKAPLSDAPRDQTLTGQAKPHSTDQAGPFQESIARAAVTHELPLHFFTRLIWQESRFDPRAISKAGAQGIAQFMPGTAQWRGLADPFEPLQALHESARWLRELWFQFGNLGLAAAAYNAGPERVTRWMSGRATLPQETRDYVRIITGQDAETWSACASTATTQAAPRLNCPEIPKSPALPAAGPPITGDPGNWGPWGLQLIGDWSEARALSEYRKLQSRFPHVLGDRKPLVLRGRMAGRGSATWYRIRVVESTRARAGELCARLERAGGKCLVFHN